MALLKWWNQVYLQQLFPKRSYLGRKSQKKKKKNQETDQIIEVQQNKKQQVKIYTSAWNSQAVTQT